MANGLQSFFNWYHDNGILPNIWKGFTGQLSSEKNTSATNQLNKQIADQNLEFQRENLDYQKALQQQIFEREDTSYQRTAQDMMSAGLNPLTMQSTNGAGEVVSTSALNNQFQAQTPQTMSPTSAISAISGIFSAIDGIKTGKLERDALALENDRKQIENLARLTELGAEKTDDGFKLKDDNRYEKVLSKELETLENTTSKSKSESEIMSTKSAHDSRELNHMIEANKYDSDSDIEQYLTAFEDWILNGRGSSMFKKVKDSDIAKVLNQPSKVMEAINESTNKAKESKGWNKFLDKTKEGLDWMKDKWNSKEHPVFDWWYNLGR